MQSVAGALEARYTFMSFWIALCFLYSRQHRHHEACIVGLSVMHCHVVE